MVAVSLVHILTGLFQIIRILHCICAASFTFCRSIKQRDSCDPDCQLSISIGTPKVEMNFAEFEVSHEQNDCNGHSHIFAKRSMKPKGVALDSNTSKSKLDSAVFRMINEKLYTCDSETAAQMLAKDGNAFL